MMRLAALASGRIRWGRIAIATLAAIIVLAIDPFIFYGQVPVVLVSAAIAYACRQRWTDFVLYLGAGLAAEFLIEPMAGPMLLMACSLALIALSGRPRFALVGSAAISAILVSAVDAKRRHAGSPLTWQDLTYFFRELDDNVGVMASQPTVLMYTGVAVVVAGLCLWVAWRVDARSKSAQDALASASRLRILVARSLPVAALAISVLALWQVNAYAYGGLRGAWYFSESKVATPVSSFLATRQLAPVAMNEMVDVSDFAEAVRKRMAADAKAAAQSPADIIVFLQESQFNPAAIAGCPPELCASNHAFTSGKSTSDFGELRVHVFGSGTWLSEFAFTVGVPHDVYGRAGAYAPFNVAPKVSGSFIRSLKKAGYHTVALYPVRGGMMNARAAYRHYGFDEFRDAADLGIEGGYGVTDQKMHQTALRVLHELEGKRKPVFLMVVTIFNHSQHGVHMERIPKDILARAAKFNDRETERRSLVDYVWRTEQFASTYEQTRSAVFNRERRSVLAWFGDHQPPFGTAPGLVKRIHERPNSHPNVPSKFVTWYQIETNFPVDQIAVKASMQDIVFLPGLIAQRAGVPLDDWLAANVVARDRCAGLYVECAESGAKEQYTGYLMDRLGALPR